MGPRRGGRPAAVATAVALVAIAAAGIGIAYSRGVFRHEPATAGTTSTTAPQPTTTTTTTPPAPVAPGRYAVASTSLDAGTTGAPPGTPGAQLATTVWYPATSSHRARPDRAHGPYPLIVFSQGFEHPPSSYQILLKAWASAGYVVAAPTYPHTDAVATYVDETDILNHPNELKTVIGAVLSAATRPGSPISDLVNTSEIGLVGQSDGADVTLAVAANTCCLYPGIKAVAVLSGAELAGFGGQYFGTAAPPLLVVQDTADPINLPACGVQIYDAAPQPKWYLSLSGATRLATAHLTPYVRANAYEAVVAKVTTDFFDAELSGQAPAAALMATHGNVPGVAQLSDSQTAPVPSGACPGAP